MPRYSRFITLAPKKKWQNTINLLNSVAEYAISGDIKAWMMQEGQLVDRHHIEPHSDKTAVKEYLRGRKLAENEDTMKEAMEALTRAIAKFEQHAVAYERRGFVNFSLKNYEDALYDYNKSIKYNDAVPKPYLGRGLVKMATKNYAEAIEDFDIAIKFSMPLQQIYWHARRVKADCFMQLKDFEAAVKELTLFSKRRFLPDNKNYPWRKKVFSTWENHLWNWAVSRKRLRRLPKRWPLKMATGMCPTSNCSSTGGFREKRRHERL